MQRILLLFLVFVCATAGAQVYKRVGPDGKVCFSDSPAKAGPVGFNVLRVAAGGR